MVVAVLLDAAQRGELGQDRRRSAPRPSMQPQRPRTPRRRARMRLSSAKTRSCATPATRGACARASAVAASGSGSRPSSAARRTSAQRAQRIVGERAAGRRPQAPRGEVGRAAVRVDELAAGQRLGHRVDGEVAQREVGLERAAAQRAEVGLPASGRARRTRQAPNSSESSNAGPPRRARERCARPRATSPSTTRSRSRGRAAAAGGRARRRRRARRARSRERRARRRDGVAHGASRRRGGSSRGTRASSPQVIS